MAKEYNIMNRLTNDRPVVIIDKEHRYEVNNSKNQAIFITQLATDKTMNEFEMMDKVIEAGLGKEALDYINSLNLSVKATGTIINTIMAAISEEDLETIEKEAAKRAKEFRKKR